MALFKCLKSKISTNVDSGTSTGTSTTSTFYIPNTPIQYSTVSGLVYDGSVNIQSFTVDEDGAATLSNVGGSHNPSVTAANLNLETGKLTLTWSSAPGANHVVLSYTGRPRYQLVSSRIFYVSCPKINQQCHSTVSATLASVTVCNQNLFV